MSNPAQPGLAFLIGGIRSTPETRYTEGVKIGSQAPQSVLYTKWPDLKSATDELGVRTAALKASSDNYHSILATLAKALEDMNAASYLWDGAFDVYLSTSGKYVQSAQDAASLSLTIRERTSNLLAPPIAVKLAYNAKRDWIRIHVTRAPGMEFVSVEFTTDLSNAASWKEMDGHGAVQYIKSPAPGTYWVRAASRTAQEKSEFTTPVSVIVR